MTLRLAAVVVFLAAASLAQAQDDWAEFTSKPGEFKVLFPGKPREQQQKLKTPDAPVVNNLFLVQKGEVVYLVSYADYPEETFKKNSPDKLLKTTRDGSMETLKGKLLIDQELTLDKTHPGREFLVQLEKGALYRARVYLAQRRLYQLVLVTTNKDNATTKEADRFFESFQLAK